MLDGGCFYPPRDYDKWGALVTSWATHVKDRYPGAESTWQWELWNEPDIGYWQGTFEEYARLYDYTEAALHAVFPNASLGGPAVAIARQQLPDAVPRALRHGDERRHRADRHTPGHGELSRQGRCEHHERARANEPRQSAARAPHRLRCRGKVGDVRPHADRHQRGGSRRLCRLPREHGAPVRLSQLARLRCLRGRDDEALARARGRGGCQPARRFDLGVHLPRLSLLRRLPRAHDERHPPARAERVQAARQPER